MSIRNRLAPRAQAPFLSEPLEGRTLLAGTALVKDLDTTPTAGMAQAEHVPVGTGAIVLFRAADPAGGHELWRSDGTDAGTFRLKDINPGTGSSAPTGLANVNGVVYFSADDGVTGHELWRSDGTTAGTLRLGDLNPGAAGSQPQEITNANGKLYFSAVDGAPGLWTSDGTAVGTRRIKQFAASPGYRPSEFRWFNNALIFRGYDAAAGEELWRSDGTTAGTARLADIFPGASSSFPHGIRTVGSTIVFGANDGTRGYEIWTTDGTTAGTKIVTELVPGPGSVFLHSPVEMNGSVYFGGTIDGSTYGLYRTDGTAPGTRLVKAAADPSFNITTSNRIVAYNGAVYFQVRQGGSLWRSDGTEAGTVNAGNPGGVNYGSAPGFIAPLGTKVYFSAATNATGSEGGALFAADAGGAGLVDPGVVDPATGRSPFVATGGVVAGGKLFVAASQQGPGMDINEQWNVRALWRSDGTQAGTTLARDVGTGTLSRHSFQLASAGSKVFFTPKAFTSEAPLWVSDGTAAGTVELPAKLQFGTDNLGRSIGSGSILYFNNAAGSLSRSDGTPAGTFALNRSAGDRFDFNGKLLFVSGDPGTGAELWISNGTVAGTTLLKDLLPGSASSSPRGFAVLNGLAYFTTTDGGSTGGRQLWRTDGTTAGTVQIAGIPNNPTDLVAAGNRLYWTNGSTLYSTDGTAAGTAVMRTFAGGSTQVSHLVNLNGTLLFAGRDANGLEIWRSNGTAAGTVPVTNIPGDALESTSPLTVAGQFAYFIGKDGATDTYGELWATDGTPGNARMVKDINPGWWPSYPKLLTAAGGTLYFVATDSFHGEELWRTDGTAAGTTLASDIHGGPASSSIRAMHAVGSTVFVAADDGIHGMELHKVNPAAPPPPSAEPVTLRSPADTYVRDGATYAATNYGTATQLQVKQGAAGYTRESYLRFDLSSVASVGAAKLRLFGKLDNTSAATAGFKVYSSTNTTWSETGVTWNAKPAAGTVVHGSGTVAGITGKWYEVDLTTFLKAEKAAGRNAVTLVLKASAASASTIVFDSDETANAPQLVVTPDGPPPPPQQGLVVSTASLSVAEGSNASFTVKLATQPASDVVVTVAKAGGGDADLNTATTSLTFTAANWNTAQTVSIAAAEDADTTNGLASFTLSSAGLTTKSVNATEADNDTPPPPPPGEGPVTLLAAADAYVRDGTSYAAVNYGTATQMQVKQGSAGYTRQGYLRFDLSSIASVGAAKLRLFGKLDNTSAATAGFTIYDAADAAWGETAINWNNKPAAGTTSRGSGTVAGITGKWYEVDLTAFLKAQKAAGKTAVTLVLKATAASGATILIDSDEAGANGPQLVVTPDGPPPQGIVVSSSNVSVPEGGNASFTVKLAVQPTSDVVVTVAKASGGDADLTTAATTLTFTSANWNVAQTVGIAAAEDADATNGTASFTLSSPGLTGKSVGATEADNDTPPPPAGPVILRAGADAYVRDGTYAPTNYGGATQLQVKQGAASYTRESYLRFDLSSVASVTSAKLRLFGKLDNTAAASAGFTIYNSSNTTWSETGVTWNAKPVAGTTARGSGTVSGTTGAWVEVDLTAFLAAEKAAGRNVVTLVLKATAASGSTILFDSDEGANRPELVVS